MMRPLANLVPQEGSPSRIDLSAQHPRSDATAALETEGGGFLAFAVKRKEERERTMISGRTQRGWGSDEYG